MERLVHGHPYIRGAAFLATNMDGTVSSWASYIRGVAFLATNT